MKQRILRLVAGLAALLALLIPFRAPSYRLWMLRVGLTEWGHYSICVSLLALFRPLRRLLGPAILGLWAGASATLLSPLLRALLIAHTLPGDLARAFGTSVLQNPGMHARSAPLIWADLLRGVRLERQNPERVTYATPDGHPLVLDVYRTPVISPAPLVIVIHGGAWQGGDPNQLPDLNHYLATRGYVVAAISYRLAPDHLFPAAYDDILAAIAFLKQNAQQYGIDPQRIVLLGRSAGGHLALLAGYRHNDQAIRGVISFYGPTDMHFSFAYPSNPRVLDSDLILRQFLGGTPQDAASQYDAASPIGFVGPTTPPTLLIHGTTDELVWIVQSQRLAARLSKAQRPYYLLELPWATHGCDANLSGPAGQLSIYAVERFLAASLAAEPRFC